MNELRWCLGLGVGRSPYRGVLGALGWSGDLRPLHVSVVERLLPYIAHQIGCFLSVALHRFSLRTGRSAGYHKSAAAPPIPRVPTN